MTALHCWHCSADIAMDSSVCPACGTYLRDRAPRRVYFNVVGGEPLSGSMGLDRPEPIRLWSPRWWGRFIVRHWRGELSLDTSFWGATIILMLAIYILPASIVAIIVDTDSLDALLSPQTTQLTNAMLMSRFLLVPIGIWQVVGTWRSAGRWLHTSPRRGWAIAARILLVPYVVLVGAIVAGSAYVLSIF